MTVRYMPLLKGRQDELAALDLVSKDTWKGMFPLVEAVPLGDADEPDSVATRGHINKLAEKLGRFASGERLALDAVHLELANEILAGTGPLFGLSEAAEVVGVSAVPVLRVTDPRRAREDVVALQARHGRGLCIRLAGEDVTEDPDDINDSLNELLAAVGMAPSSVDLLIDLGVVDADSVRANAFAASVLIRTLEHVQSWRSLTVASGAFPADLSGFSPWQEGEQPRSDADAWAEVVRRRLPRSPDFGDYAVAHPLLGAGVPFAPAPQLRYAAASHWVVLKGDRRDPRGSSQFYDICEAIATGADFAGAALGPADQRIANSRAQGTGSATTWRTLGTAHHLDFVVRRLTSLGEP